MSDKTCRYCGEGGLHWSPAPCGHRLTDSAGNMHRCPAQMKHTLEALTRVRSHLRNDDPHIAALRCAIDLAIELAELHTHP